MDTTLNGTKPNTSRLNRGNQPHINLAFLIVGALVHQDIIPVESLDDEMWADYGFAVKIVAAILKNHTDLGEFPGLPFDI